MTRAALAWPGMRAPGVAAALLAVALLVMGCAARSVYDRVYEHSGTEVRLRTLKRGTTIVERDFEHPFTISSVRIAHILSRIDIRTEAKDGLQRGSAIPLDTLYSIADGVSQALAQAGPDQEVVVLSLRKTRRWGVFNRDYLTSFVCYRKEGLLYVHLSRSDWEVSAQQDDKLPQPRIGEHPLKFKVMPGQAMTLADSQSVAVEWRDPVFEKPTRTRVDSSGKVVRRTILMESDVDESDLEEEEQEPAPLPGGLSPEQLRGLANLEDKRRRGEVTEAEYMAERRDVLEGKVPSD